MRRARVHSAEYHREMRRLKRRRSDKTILYVVVIGASLALMVVELGRAVRYTQHVGAFALTLDQKTPAEVKKELQGFAVGLGDHNVLIRNSSIAALKVATGWNLGNNPLDWQKWWYDHESMWTYRPSKGTNAPPAQPATASSP